MSSTMINRSDNEVAVWVMGLLTLLFGGGYSALGGSLVVAGVAAPAHARAAFGEDWAPLATLFGVIPAIFIAIGVGFLLLGILLLLAGLGLLWRNELARILTLILAVFVILLGLVLALVGRHDVATIAVGAVQVIYGILAFVILISRRTEFGQRAGM
jgi:hypothetical protein